MIAGDALRPGIQRRLPIHKKTIMMVAVTQQNLRVPRAIGMTLHRVRRGMPAIEIARKENALCVGRVADEVDRLAEVFGGITIARKPGVRLGPVHCSGKT